MKILIRVLRDWEAETIATLSLADGGNVVCDPPEQLDSFLRDFETVGPDGDWHTIDEGEAWLENLPRALRGTYLFADFAEAPDTAASPGTLRT